MKAGLSTLFFSQAVHKTLKQLKNEHQDDRADVEHAEARHKPADRIQQLINDAIRLSNAQMAHIMQNEGCGNCFIRAWQSSNELNERLRMGVLKVSDTLSQLLGYSKEEISGWSEKEIERVIHPMERREFMNSFEKALLDENSAHEFTNKVQNKSGYFKRVKVVMTSVRLEDNSHLAYLNVVGD